MTRNVADIPPAPPWASWMENPDRHCRTVDPNTFFVTRGDHAGTERAKAVCAGCPVLNECREYAIEYRLIGVWGGTSGKERRAVIRARNRVPAPRPMLPEQHGSPSGYNLHRNRGEAPCRACRDARTAYEVERRRQVRLVQG